MGTRTSRFLACLAFCTLLAGPSPALGFSPNTQATIAREAAALAPPDLARQIEKHRLRLKEGALLPFQDRDGLRHVKDTDGSGSLDRVILEEVERAVAAIRGHAPFSDVIAQLGVVSHFVADANNPLNAASSDPREADFFADYLDYVEAASPRFPLVFYGVDRGLPAQPDVSGLVRRSLERSRRLYPLVGQEYRRVGFASGRRTFDDRSTAFGISSLAFSHAVNDVAEVFRFIWLKAGGADGRSGLPERGGALLALPRAGSGS